MTKTSNRLNWTGYALRLAAAEASSLYDIYRARHVSVEVCMRCYYDPIYRADGSRRRPL